MIIIHMSVHLSLSSIIIIYHVRYASIIIIIDVHLVIFHDGAWVVLGSNTINDNSRPPPRCCRATPSHKHVMIVTSSLWLTFVNNIKGGRGVQSVSDVDPVWHDFLLTWYRLPSFLDTSTDWNSTSFSFRLRNNFLVLCNCFLVLRNHFLLMW